MVDYARYTCYNMALCAACHGLDGWKRATAPSLALALGEAARRKPWESLHKLLNGYPDELTPSLRALDRQIAVDMIAYLQTLPGSQGVDGKK